MISKKVLINKNSMNILLISMIKLLLLMFVLQYGWECARYIKNLFLSWQFVEPAENENMVLIWSIKQNFSINLEELISRGVFPIYPDLFHRLAALVPMNALFSGRLISVISFSLTIILIMLWIFNKTRSIIISSFFSILSFGVTPHSIYYIMNRVDGLAFLLGFSSLLLVWWNFNLKNSFENEFKMVPLWKFILAAILVALSNLTKQTYVVFSFILFIPFFVLFFQRKFQYLPVFLWTTFTFIVVNIGYFIFINDEIFKYYYYGVQLFATNFSLQSFLVHFRSGFIPNYSILTVVCLYILFYTNKIQDKTWYLILGTTVGSILLIVIKTWGNAAAYNNNFTLLTAIIVFVLFLFWKTNEQKIQWLLLLILLLVFNQAMWYNNMNAFNSYTKALKSSKTDRVEMSSFLQSLPDKIITDRLDNYLLFSGHSISYEGSVMTSILNNTTFSSPYSPIIDAFKVQLRERIKSGYYNAIILGIQAPLFLKVFPEVNKKYEIRKVQIITTGQFTYELILMEPKKEYQYGN